MDVAHKRAFVLFITVLPAVKLSVTFSDLGPRVVMTTYRTYTIYIRCFDATPSKTVVKVAYLNSIYDITMCTHRCVQIKSKFNYYKTSLVIIRSCWVRFSCKAR